MSVPAANDRKSYGKLHTLTETIVANRSLHLPLLEPVAAAAG